MQVPDSDNDPEHRGGGPSRVLSWLDEDDPPPPEEPPPSLPGSPVPEQSGGPLPWPVPGYDDELSAPGRPTDRVGAGSLWARRRLVLGARVLAAAAVLALVSTGLYLAGLRLAQGDSDDRRGAARIVSAPLTGLDRADFELASGATKVTVRGGAADDALYRISTPENGGTVPEVVRRGGRVVLRLVRTGRAGPDEVDIQLSGRVSWTVRLTGGAATRVVDASRLALRGLTVSTGSTRTELSLPKPTSRVPIRLAGGFDTVAVQLPVGVPARLTVGKGAGRVVIDGRIREGVAAGRILGTVGWQRSLRRYEIDLTAGASTVTVQRPGR